MESTDLLLLIVVIILSITQIAFFTLLIKLLIEVRNLAKKLWFVAESTENTILTVRKYFTKQWPTISLLSWGIKKFKRGG